MKTSALDNTPYDDVHRTIEEEPIWLSKALTRPENSWYGKWASLESEVAEMKNIQESGFQVVKKIDKMVEAVRIEQESQKEKAQADLDKTREFLVTLGTNQQVIEKGQQRQMDTLHSLQEEIVQELHEKLETSIQELKKSQTVPPPPQRGSRDSYADRAAALGTLPRTNNDRYRNISAWRREWLIHDPQPLRQTGLRAGVS